MIFFLIFKLIKKWMIKEAVHEVRDCLCNLEQQHLCTCNRQSRLKRFIYSLPINNCFVDNGRFELLLLITCSCPVGWLNKCTTVTHCEINQARKKWLRTVTKKEETRTSWNSICSKKIQKRFRKNVDSFNATAAIIDWKTEL